MFSIYVFNIITGKIIVEFKGNTYSNLLKAATYLYGEEEYSYTSNLDLYDFDDDFSTVLILDVVNS